MHLKFIFKIFLLLSILLLAGCRAKTSYQFMNADWPKFRGPNGNSISIETGWNPLVLTNKKIKPLWTQSVGMGYSSVSIKGDYIYTIGFNRKDSTESVICMNIKDGKIIWQYDFPSIVIEYAGSRATPYLEGNNLYATGCDGKIICLDALKGSLNWEKDLIKDFKAGRPIWGFAGSPAIDGDLLILNANQNGIALNKNTGETVWASKPDVCGYATPVIFTYNNTKYAAIFSQSKLFVVEIFNGNILASYDWKTSYDVNAADPIVSGNKIFISSDYGRGAECLELSGNKLSSLWSSNMSNHFTSSVLIDDYIIGIKGQIGQNTSILCIDFNTGEKLWEDSSEQYGSFIIADTNKMIGLSTIGSLFIAEISKSGFKKISEGFLKADVYWTTPVLCRGMIFVRNEKGYLYCIDAK